MKYLPFLAGGYSVSPGLTPMQKARDPLDQLVFQVDDLYETYIQNKIACRQENIHKYYCQVKLFPETALAVNQYLAEGLVREHPGIFSLQTLEDGYLLTNKNTGEKIAWGRDWLNVRGDFYQSLFDALCSQAQEDFAICQLEEQKDWMAAIHLCAPNHWAATDKTGKPFDIVHAPVPGMEKTMKHYFKMLSHITQKGPFTRFAWGIASDKRLNHHPEPPPGADPDEWYGRKANQENLELHIRVERQNLIGLPKVNAFLFTIRTYFYPVESCTNEEKQALLEAIKNMSPEALRYKGLSGKEAFFRKKLKDSFPDS